MRIEIIIKNYVDKLNEKFDVYLDPIVEKDSNYRFPVYCSCVNNAIYVCEELFEALTEEQKQKHVCFAFSMLFAAKFYGQETMVDGHKVYELSFNPNIIVEELFIRAGLRFSSFEELQREIYETKQRLYPYPDLRGSFFRKGDILRRKGISRFIVKNIFSEDRVVMVEVQSLNSFDKMTKVIKYPEVEMMGMFRIEEPVEFKNIN